MPVNRLGQLTKYSLDQATLTLSFKGGAKVQIVALTPNLVRVRLAPKGKWQPRRPWAVNRADADFPPNAVELDETANLLVLRTGGIDVRVQRDPCRIRFTTPEGRTFFADSEGIGWDDKSGAVQVEKRLTATEYLFGFGQRAGTLLNRRGHTITNWTTDPPWGHHTNTDPMYMAVPVFVSAQSGLAFGVYFNNTFRSQIDAGSTQPDVLRMTADGGELDYYVLYGPTPVEVNARIAELLGSIPLPPLWALGYHQSRWGYRSAEDMLEVLHQMRGRGLPLDAIHFDIDYMHGYRVFTWNDENFPDFPALVQTLRKEGIHPVTIIDPGVKVDPDYAVYADGLEKGMFITTAKGKPFEGYVWPDLSVWPDFSRPDVREWWGDQQAKLVQAGITGIWNDMNEPAVFTRPFSEGGGDVTTIPSEAPQGSDDARTTHAEVHNLYGSHMAQASYEGLRKHLPNERPFVLTRAGFAGVQRYSASWMGDNTSWWEHLETSLPQMMNMGLSGVPFVGVDIGGFSGNATPELFSRWMQFGALMPFARGHSAAGTIAHEPWAFGPEVEAVARLYLNLRYQLLPYFYSLFYAASQHGTPIVRPLFYHFPTDDRLYNLQDQAMIGPALMVAPIVRPAATHRHVYFPEGDWTHWWTREVFIGPTDVLVEAPMLQMPLFVRAGAILPLAALGAQHTGQVRLNPLAVEIYPGEGEFELYEDDGQSFAYQNGDYALTPFVVQREGAQLVVDIGARQGSFELPERPLVLNIHHVGEAAGKAAALYPDTQYDAHMGVLSMMLEDDGTSRTLRFNL